MSEIKIITSLRSCEYKESLGSIMLIPTDSVSGPRSQAQWTLLSDLGFVGINLKHQVNKSDEFYEHTSYHDVAASGEEDFLQDPESVLKCLPARR